MRAVTGGLIAVVLGLGFITLSMKEPDIEGFSLMAYKAHEIPDIGEPYDYRGEQSALKARAQTRRYEYVKSRLERERAKQRSQVTENGSSDEGEARTQSAPSMSHVARVVAACESGKRRSGRPVVGTLSWTADNPRTTASGAFQFLDGTWQRLAASQGYARAKHAPPHVQKAAFNELYRKRGLRPWLASASCWRPVLR